MLGHNSRNAPELQRRPGDWIALHRGVIDHPIVGFDKDEPRTRAEAWLDLMVLANYRTTEVANRGRVLLIQPGQLMAARSWLAKRWNWSEKKVRWFMQLLVDEGMVTWTNAEATQAPVDPSFTGQRSGGERGGERGQHRKPPARNTASVLTLCNYSKYQYNVSQIEKYTEQVNRGQQNGQHPGPQTDHTLTREQSKQGKEGGAPNGASHPAPRSDADATRATRLPRDWQLPPVWQDETLRKYVITVNEVIQEEEKFRNYWIAKAGAQAKKVDWLATWRGWVARDHALRQTAALAASTAPADLAWLDDPKTVANAPRSKWRETFAKYLLTTHQNWNLQLGPAPGGPSKRKKIPDRVIEAFGLNRLYNSDGSRTNVPLPWAEAEQGSLLT